MRSGVRADGTKEILGLWLEQNEGAKFRLRVMNELKNRGVEDVLIAGHRRLQRLPRGDHRRLLAGDGADLHCRPAAPRPRFRLFEKS
jgi:putative transposase